MNLPQQSNMKVLDVVRDYIIPFNSIIAMAVTVVAVLDFLAPQGAYLAWFSYALVLLCHKRSRTFTVAQYGQCPKALASATLN